MKTITFKVSDSENRMIEKLAEQSAASKSEILREAIKLITEKQKTEDMKKELRELQSSILSTQKAIGYVLKNSIQSRMLSALTAQSVSKEDYHRNISKYQESVDAEFEKILTEIRSI